MGLPESFRVAAIIPVFSLETKLSGNVAYVGCGDCTVFRQKLGTKEATRSWFRSITTGMIQDVTAICAFSPSALMIAPFANSEPRTIFPHFSQCVDGANSISSNTLAVTRGPIEGLCMEDGALYWMADHTIFSADVKLCQERPTPTVEIPVRKGKMECLIKRESDAEATRVRLNALDTIDPRLSMSRPDVLEAINQASPCALQNASPSDREAPPSEQDDRMEDAIPAEDDPYFVPGTQPDAKANPSHGQLTDANIAALEAIWDQQCEKFGLGCEAYVPPLDTDSR